jgi:signal transduction histidine kinase
MLKLHQFFFRTSVVFVVVVLVVASIFGFFIIKSYEIDSTIKNLKRSLDLTTINSKIDNNYLKNIAKKGKFRVTYIDKNGKVLFDSMNNINSMDNHKNRPEIIASKIAKYGVAIRDSKTVKKELVYVAKSFNGKYLRFSKLLSNIYSKVYYLVSYLILFFITILGALFYFSTIINKKIAQDSKKIDEALESMLNKEFSIYLEDVNCCQEFKNIAKKIAKVAKKLKKREKQKRKYTKRLKEITKRQGDIISAISHEFKNPVAAIVGYAQTLQDTPNLNENLKSKFLEKIESNATKISNMIDTLALSIKLENQSIALNKEEFNLSSVAKSAKEILEQKYKNRDIILNCEDIVVNADKGMFESVFINLIENALKYSDDEVVVNCNQDRVEIIDKGIGIDKSDIEKIKQKFYRADGISWNNSIGVGLYIVDYILKLHNIELEIKSDEDNTVFSFSLDGLVN